MYIYRRTKESGRKRQAKRTQNGSEASRSVQKCLKIMKILKNGSERSPRDKSGAFGFENMFWPLGNVARRKGVTGVQAGGLCAYGSRGACVSCMHPVAPCTYVAPVSSLLYL